MKTLFYFFALALTCTTASAQTFVVHKELGQAWGGGTTVDINNDGHLDFIMTGNKPDEAKVPVLDDNGNTVDADNNGIADSTNKWAAVYLYNPTNKTYESVFTNFRVTERTNMDWVDLDNDGLLDVIASEHDFGNYHGGIYKNLGTGKFELIDTFLTKKIQAAAFGDFNNDGKLDYVGISNDSLGSAVFMNNGDGTYEKTNEDVFGAYRFGLGQVHVVDINKDGLSDIFISANWDNAQYFDPSARVLADFFLNNNEEPGTFYRANIGDNGVKMKANGGVDFADFNGDGWIDMALHGEGGAGTNEPGEGMDIWRCISHIYINQKNNTFKDQAQTAFQPDLRPLNSTGRATATIDWDNDGNYDLIITGWNPKVGEIGTQTQAGYLYKGNGSGTFSEVGRVPGGSETVLLFNDWNDDGVLDYVSSGHSWDEMFVTGDQVGRTAVLYYNPNTSSKNVAPSAPTNLAVTGASNGKVTFTWDAATDSKSPSAILSYEFFLKGSDGKYIVAPKSFVGGDKDGLRKVLEMGNNFLNTSKKIIGLADGTYTWGVQAIDASYAGSTFATNTFTVSDGTVDVRETNLSKLNIYPNPATNVINVQSPEILDNISILSLDGRLVKSVNNINSVDVSNLAQGIYIIKLAQGNEVYNSKIVVK